MGKSTIVGTGFLVERSNALAASGKDYIAVTAAHVLQQISGNTATFQIPMTQSDGTQQRVFLVMTIRRNGAPTWTELAGSDVAVMYVPLPSTGVKPIGFDRLATDEDVARNLLLGVGDSASVLSYPFGYEFNEFPVVRNARLASYPLAPAHAMKRLVVGFTAFGGDSGGPLYVEHGSGNAQPDEDVMILGIVIQQVLAPDGIQNTGLTFVTPAAFVREAIGLLPRRGPEGAIDLVHGR